MKTLYTYPQEVWDVKKCEAIAKRRERDGCGTLHPFYGRVSGVSAPYPEYGQTVRFNGGTLVKGELFASVSVPLPVIPDSFHFVTRSSWGTYLERKKI